ncbi:ABC transporter ATP-binding protein [Oricola indica]|uniref:ABC transporter ATP-binding protein n=1 Tax=Oricola indica TaxID=2872591 RepID=UPI003CCBC12C|tara:strand:- start:9027 stop:10013 length:987 start_codon:yes stop_codon:yes gene_type:complete
MQPLMRVEDLKVHFPVRNQGLTSNKLILRAVDGVSFDIQQGETLAVVGESGCGKSTTGNALLGLTPVTSGRVFFDGDEISAIPAGQRSDYWKDIQAVFQDPVAALNPRRTIGKSIGEPLRILGRSVGSENARVSEVMELVGLQQSHRDRFPNELSGGQRQRAVIARALATGPKMIICDEPVSALDVSIQSQILNLLLDLQKKLDLTLLFISHDLSVVRHIADRILVMYLGQIVEEADATQLFDTPRHPYTQALLSAVLVPDPCVEQGRGRKILEGELPSPLSVFQGCAFASRCPLRESQCELNRPKMVELEAEHKVRCLVREREAEPI